MLFLLTYLNFILCLAPSHRASAAPCLPPCLDRYCSCEYPMIWILNSFRYNRIQRPRTRTWGPTLTGALRLTNPRRPFLILQGRMGLRRCYVPRHIEMHARPKFWASGWDIVETCFEPRAVRTLRLCASSFYVTVWSSEVVASPWNHF
jgi:hypothetical protein